MKPMKWNGTEVQQNELKFHQMISSEISRFHLFSNPSNEGFLSWQGTKIAHSMLFVSGPATVMGISAAVSSCS